MARARSGALYAVLAVMAAFLVVGGVLLFYVAYRGMQVLRSEASHAATVMMGDAAALAGKSDYVGSWKGSGVSLDVLPSGHADYQRTEGHGRLELHGAVSFDGSDIVIDVLVTKKRLHVDTPPHRTDAGWSMTVDGALLRRP